MESSLGNAMQDKDRLAFTGKETKKGIMDGKVAV